MRWLVIDHNREDRPVEKFKLFGSPSQALKCAKTLGWGKDMGSMAPGIPTDPGCVAVFIHGCEVNLEVVCLASAVVV